MTTDRLARALEGVTPVQAYRIGIECGRLSARLESINRRLEAHLLRLGVTQEQLDAIEPYPINTKEN